MSSMAGVAKSEQLSAGLCCLRWGHGPDAALRPPAWSDNLFSSECQKKTRVKLLAIIQDQFVNACKVMAGTVMERRPLHHCSVRE